MVFVMQVAIFSPVFSLPPSFSYYPILSPSVFSHTPTSHFLPSPYCQVYPSSFFPNIPSYNFSPRLPHFLSTPFLRFLSPFTPSPYFSLCLSQSFVQRTLSFHPAHTAVKTLVTGHFSCHAMTYRQHLSSHNCASVRFNHRKA